MISKKGSIIVALVFVLVLSITAMAFLAMIGGRSAFTIYPMKRAQAINCAEAALYEAFNRFRTRGWDPTQNRNGGTNDTIYVPTAIAGVNVPVRIFYTYDSGNRRGEISAKVKYSDVQVQ